MTDSRAQSHGSSDTPALPFATKSILEVEVSVSCKKIYALNKHTFSSELVQLVFPTHLLSRWTSWYQGSSSVCTSASAACADRNRKSAVSIHRPAAFHTAITFNFPFRNYYNFQLLFNRSIFPKLLQIRLCSSNMNFWKSLDFLQARQTFIHPTHHVEVL